MDAPVIYQKLAVDELTARLSSKSKSSHYCVKEAVLETHCHVRNQLLGTHVIKLIIAETDPKVTGYVKPSNM